MTKETALRATLILSYLESIENFSEVMEDWFTELSHTDFPPGMVADLRKVIDKHLKEQTDELDRL